MNLQQLDFYFPFIVMVYGLIMTLVLSSQTLMKIAETRLPAYFQQRFRAQQGLGMICLVVGTIWSLQNIWLT